MTHSSWRWPSLLGAVLIVSWFMGCSGDDPSGEGSAMASSSGGSVSPDAMCDVLAILQQQCWSCHGTALHGDAPISLVTLDQLKAPSASDPSSSYAERSALRMESTSSPMPPGEDLTSTPDQVALLKAWIAAGYPIASCGDAAEDPYAATAKCTSGQQLDPNQQEGEEMNPGHACNACHQQINIEQGGDAPIFAVVGTIFPTAHEPDDCRAPASKGAQVEITDSNGKVFLAEANDSGNFFYEDADLVVPYTARVIFEGRERRMSAPQTDGECNACHTQAGAEDAPGRILLP